MGYSTICSAETSVAFQRTMLRHNSEDSTLHGLRMFENRVLTRIFAPKKDEVIGGWRKLHNEELVLLVNCN
jgi:hypothetical protein